MKTSSWAAMEEFDIAAKVAAVVDIAAAVEPTVVDAAAAPQRDPFASFAAAGMHYWAQKKRAGQLVVEPMATWRWGLQELIVAAVLAKLAVAVVVLLAVAVLAAVGHNAAEAGETQIQASEASDLQTEATPLKQLAADIQEAQRNTAAVVAVAVLVVAASQQ